MANDSTATIHVFRDQPSLISWTYSNEGNLYGPSLIMPDLMKALWDQSLFMKPLLHKVDIF